MDPDRYCRPSGDESSGPPSTQSHMQVPPHGDVVSTEGGTSGNNPSQLQGGGDNPRREAVSHFPVQAQMDVASSSNFPDLQRRAVNPGVSPAGGARPYESSDIGPGGAQPFIPSDGSRPTPLPGPRPEHSNASNTNSPIDSSHLGAILAAAKRPLITDLKTVIGLTDQEEYELDNIRTKKGQCEELLHIWKRREGREKILFDLIDLLTRAGGADNRYENLINQIKEIRIPQPRLFYSPR